MVFPFSYKGTLLLKQKMVVYVNHLLILTSVFGMKWLSKLAYVDSIMNIYNKLKFLKINSAIVLLTENSSLG